LDILETINEILAEQDLPDLSLEGKDEFIEQTGTPETTTVRLTIDSAFG
jgi:hypothetical protein